MILGWEGPSSFCDGLWVFLAAGIRTLQEDLGSNGLKESPIGFGVGQ